MPEAAATGTEGANPAPGGFVRRVVGNAAWGQGGQMTAFALQILFQLILARGLGADDYGIFAAVNSGVYLIIGLIAGGSGATINAHASRFDHVHGRAATAYLFWKNWLLRLVGFAAVAVVLVLFSNQIASLYLGVSMAGELIVAATLYMVAVGMWGIHLTLFYGLLATRWAAISVAAQMLLNVVVAGYVIWTDASLTELFLLMALGQFLLLIFQIAISWRMVPPHRDMLAVAPEAKAEIKGLWRFSMTVYLTGTLSVVLARQVDIFILQLFRVPSADIGFYNVAMTLGIAAKMILLFGIGAVGQATLSTVYARDPSRLSGAWRMLASVSPLLSIPILAFTGVFAPWIVQVLYGTEYDPAALMLQILVVFMLVGQFFGGGAHQTVFQTLSMPGKILRVRVGTGALNIAGNVVLIPFLGAIGAIVATGVSMALTSLFEYRLIKPIVRDNLPWGDYARALVGSVPGLVPAWLLVSTLGLLGVLVGGLVYLLSYLAAARLLRPMSVDRAILTSLPGPLRQFVRVRPDDGLTDGSDGTEVAATSPPSA